MSLPETTNPALWNAMASALVPTPQMPIKWTFFGLVLFEAIKKPNSKPFFQRLKGLDIIDLRVYNRQVKFWVGKTTRCKLKDFTDSSFKMLGTDFCLVLVTWQDTTSLLGSVVEVSDTKKNFTETRLQSGNHRCQSKS